jgi:hypothetical protein
MAPTVVGTGAVASSAAAITPALPGSLAVDDIIIGVGECEGVTAPGRYFDTTGGNPPAPWAHVSSDGTPVSPVLQGTNTRLTAIWTRYDGTQTAFSWGDAGDHNLGRYIAIRGCPGTGNPWNAVATAVEATSDT